jgi:hypothetical protein
MAMSSKYLALSSAGKHLWIWLLSEAAKSCKREAIVNQHEVKSYVNCTQKSLNSALKELVSLEWVQVVRTPYASKQASMHAPISSASAEYVGVSVPSFQPPKDPDQAPKKITERDQCDRLLEAWNGNCGACRQAKALNAKRRKRCKAALKKYTIEQLCGFALEIGNNPFCTGENKSGWVADFDYFLKESTLVKAEEGGFVAPKTVEELNREFINAF